MDWKLVATPTCLRARCGSPGRDTGSERMASCISLLNVILNCCSLPLLSFLLCGELVESPPPVATGGVRM